MGWRSISWEHLHNFLSFSLFFCLHIHSSVSCLIIIIYFWADDLTRKMYLAVIFVSSLTACCESVLQLMAIDPVMHISSVILSPQSVTFSPAHCTTINPFGQSSEITSNAAHKPCRDVRKQMLSAFYCLIMITDVFALRRLVCLGSTFPIQSVSRM